MKQPLVYQDEDILGGIPVFYGTRVPVKNLLDYLKTGETIDIFLEDFPSVTRQQVQAFLEMATQLMIENTDAQSLPIVKIDES